MVKKWWSQDFRPDGSYHRVPCPKELPEKGAGISDAAVNSLVDLAVFMAQIELLGPEM